LKSWIRAITWPIILLTLVGCSAPHPNPTASDQSVGLAPEGPARNLAIAQLNLTKGFGPWWFASTGGGGASLGEIHTVGLTSEDRNGNIEPRAAARLPSLDDGTIVIQPDGRMETTWKLRPDVKWHNGAPFTADDVVFSVELARFASETSPLKPGLARAERVQALDPLTVRITWPTTFYRALYLGHRDLWPYPRDLLAEAFQGDKDAMLDLPYFTDQYINLGPFRLVDFGLGQHLVFERFDAFYLGRPKISRIVIQAIEDPNTALAHLKAGAVDLLPEQALNADVAIQLRDEWRQTGGGTVLARQNNWLRFAVQLDSRWVEPAELGRDVRIRRGLLQAIDRDTLREAMLPGFPDTSGDTFVRSTDALGGVVGRPFARYPFDPARAAQLLAEGGWQRGADGRLLNQQGAPVRVEMRGAPIYAREVAIAADYWRQAGVDVTEVIPNAVRSREPEYRSTFPGVDTNDRGSGDTVFVTFDGRSHALAENRWSGANFNHYVNPNMDRLIDQLYITVGDQQAQVIKQMSEILAEDVPVLPLYFKMSFAAVRQGVRAMTDDYPGTVDSGAAARYAYLWDRDAK
jgi:peptide/nickel transport system substrate-binding protein